MRSSDVCHLAQVSYRQLDYWARTGLLVPEVEASGSGSQRVYGEDQVGKARVLGAISKALVTSGGRPEAATDLLRLVAGHPTGIGTVRVRVNGIVLTLTIEEERQEVLAS